MERESPAADFFLAMMKRNHTRLCAGAAIAAVLALSSTPTLAQMAPTSETASETPAVQPVPTFPEATAPAPLPAETQPAIVLPTTLPAAVYETTVAAPEPTAEPTPVEAEAAPATTRTERVAPRAAAPATNSMPSEPQAVATESEPTPIAADTTAEPVETAAPAEPAETAPLVTNEDNAQFWVAVLAGLVAVALAIWGFIAIGRRKTVQRRIAAVERPVVTPRPEPAERIATSAPTVTPLATARPQTAAPSLAHSGAAVALPSRMPATFAERDALLKRMVSAKPDRANPFTTPKARLKRARLILQSLGRDFDGREPWIDFSQYPSNWREPASRDIAAA